MTKPIIGIISPRNVKVDEPFNNYTRMVDNYFKRVSESGGIPIGVSFPDGKFTTEVLDICDGIILTGGSNLDSTYINTIHYALRNNIPVLAVCMGMQALAGYESTRNIFGTNFPSYQMIEDVYTPKEEDLFLEKVSNHNNVNPFNINDIAKAKHNIKLDNNSKIKSIYNKEVISKPSVHNYKVKENIFGNFFKVTGRTEDNVIEVVENIDPNQWVIGVQWHPELEKENNILFEAFINEAKKHIK